MYAIFHLIFARILWSSIWFPIVSAIRFSHQQHQRLQSEFDRRPIYLDKRVPRNEWYFIVSYLETLHQDLLRFLFWAIFFPIIWYEWFWEVTCESSANILQFKVCAVHVNVPQVPLPIVEPLSDMQLKIILTAITLIK